ncbi:hypothetical protein FPCIR_3678 [Fusarium pseudocircinatum]|uniref:Uncharacterized protein n=1 Tax=Fusarium pseudocircinatum TaxID=56676 RepID=A0A8H5PHZ6_9HYPO|nr:hypothetical protein FPCIR_3678 [Fusarium pseudocircinatum]
MLTLSQSHQQQLPVVPENSVVTTWQQPIVTQQQQQQQQQQQAYFVSRLAGELLEDAFCWHQEYERLLGEYWKVSEHNAALLGQVSRLKEQLRSARSTQGTQRARCDSGSAVVSTSKVGGASGTMSNAIVGSGTSEGIKLAGSQHMSACQAIKRQTKWLRKLLDTTQPQEPATDHKSNPIYYKS